MIAREIIPNEAGEGIVNIRQIVLERKFVCVLPLEIVRTFLSAICDLPGFFVVVRCNRCCRPNVAVARNFAAIVEVVENTELQCELVLVGRDVLPVHC